MSGSTAIPPRKSTSRRRDSVFSLAGLRTLLDSSTGRRRHSMATTDSGLKLTSEQHEAVNQLKELLEQRRRISENIALDDAAAMQSSGGSQIYNDMYSSNSSLGSSSPADGELTDTAESTRVGQRSPYPVKFPAAATPSALPLVAQSLDRITKTTSPLDGAPRPSFIPRPSVSGRRASCAILPTLEFRDKRGPLMDAMFGGPLNNAAGTPAASTASTVHSTPKFSPQLGGRHKPKFESQTQTQNFCPEERGSQTDESCLQYCERGCQTEEF